MLDTYIAYVIWGLHVTLSSTNFESGPLLLCKACMVLRVILFQAGYTDWIGIRAPNWPFSGRPDFERDIIL